MVWQFIWAETDNTLRHTWQQIRRHCRNWQRIYTDVATNCIRTITSPPWTYSITWPGNNFTLVALPTQQEGHDTRLRPQRVTLQQGDLQVWTAGNLTNLEGQTRCTYFDQHPRLRRWFLAIITGRPKSLKLWQIITATGSVKIREMEWLIPILSTVAHGSGQKLFFHLFYLVILKSYIHFSSLVGKKISHSGFRNNLMGNLLVQAGQESNVQRSIGRPPAAAGDVTRFEERGRKHWAFRSATRRRRVCSDRGHTRNVITKCERCDVALCWCNTCFKVYHTKADRWNSSGISTGSSYVKLGPQLEM